MSENHPLYPELPEAAEEEAMALIEKFKRQLVKAAEDVIGDLYCEVMPYIESDTWSNFRNEIMNGFSKYTNRKIQGAYDFAKIRRSIFDEYRDEIIADLDQDNLAEIERQKAEIKRLYEQLDRTRW